MHGIVQGFIQINVHNEAADSGRSRSLPQARTLIYSGVILTLPLPPTVIDLSDLGHPRVSSLVAWATAVTSQLAPLLRKRVPANLLERLAMRVM